MMRHLPLNLLKIDPLTKNRAADDGPKLRGDSRHDTAANDGAVIVKQ
jgi:hypothetical protein